MLASHFFMSKAGQNMYKWKLYCSIPCLARNIFNFLVLFSLCFCLHLDSIMEMWKRTAMVLNMPPWNLQALLLPGKIVFTRPPTWYHAGSSNSAKRIWPALRFSFPQDLAWTIQQIPKPYAPVMLVALRVFYKLRVSRLRWGTLLYLAMQRVIFYLFS